MSGHFLKCDAVGCDHRENVDGLTEAMVGKPCPNCGESLLTREDFDMWERDVAPVIALMRALGVMRDAKEGEQGDFSVHAHAGELTVKHRAVPNA